MQEKEYTIKDLIIRLDQEGFGSSKPTIWRWEKEGVIPKAIRIKKENGMMERRYSKADLDEIVRILKARPQKKTLIC